VSIPKTGEGAGPSTFLGTSGVVVGYAHLSEPAIVRAVAALGEAVERARG